ncbi:uncharacterized protein CC84DRAFT_446600 [Paraphaeosphaeria sporulosa]|uniref:Uncharacterized protein n=1 Tax=Paraphaeosphaeria sporulosa TaxID=1460663 RepID=A0A177CSC6_9PLEO|nr:uncharacterized protein CC84DRAFT_446600 [Paraphaeosphaeria sporulosa]OAG09659.1 hypothetical protein CC84DRAFT_446600 [Paraphaeosphaeria sporulosa]
MPRPAVTAAAFASSETHQQPAPTISARLSRNTPELPTNFLLPIAYCAARPICVQPPPATASPLLCAASPQGCSRYATHPTKSSLSSRSDNHAARSLYPVR